ncbi:MAG: Smr/MutS family protein [Planctomycetota bacterium]
MTDFPDPRARVDLHGLDRARALQRVRETLIRARALGHREVLVVTGRGLGNRTQTPILRGHVEAWLKGNEGRGLGVLEIARIHQGGALRVRLGGPNRASRG